MIDKIVLGNESAIVVYTNRSPILITSTGTPIRTFIRWFFTPVVITYPEFKRAVEIELEDTQNISIKDVA